MEIILGIALVVAFVFAILPRPKVLTNHYICSIDECDFQFASNNHQWTEFTKNEHEQYHVRT